MTSSSKGLFWLRTQLGDSSSFHIASHLQTNQIPQISEFVLQLDIVTKRKYDFYDVHTWAYQNDYRSFDPAHRLYEILDYRVTTLSLWSMIQKMIKISFMFWGCLGSE